MHVHSIAEATLFVHEHVVKLHDTDCYGIIFFANQFRICHDAWQAFLAHDGIPLLPDRSHLSTLPVIVHAECDYLAKVVVDDRLRVEVSLERIGTTSFSLRYAISNARGATGSGRTVHVCIDAASDAKQAVPQRLREALGRL